MLKEIGQIARDMLFMHGHFTRPQDLAETQVVAPVAEDKGCGKALSPRRKAARAARREAALFAAVMGHAGSFR
jgi:hypothetical protein